MREYMTNLSDKQVINICDGRIIGYVSDFKLDPCDGRLIAIIVPAETRLFAFRRCSDIIIPWEKICKIGKDVILVDIGISTENTLIFDEKYNKKRLK